MSLERVAKVAPPVRADPRGLVATVGLERQERQAQLVLELAASTASVPTSALARAAYE